LKIEKIKSPAPEERSVLPIHTEKEIKNQGKRLDLNDGKVEWEVSMPGETRRRRNSPKRGWGQFRS